MAGLFLPGGLSDLSSVTLAGAATQTPFQGGVPGPSQGWGHGTGLRDCLGQTLGLQWDMETQGGPEAGVPSLSRV